MHKRDLETMSIKELEQLQRNVTKALTTYHSRLRREARAKLDAVAKEYGFASAEELVAGKSTKTKKNSGPVFRNPEDHNQVCGRQGRKPKWFKSLLEKGYTEKQLLIENQHDRLQH